MESEEEIWKPIRGYEGIYEISSNGRIKSLERERLLFGRIPTVFREKIMSPKRTPEGYLQIGLRNPNQRLFYVHRLVAESFIENPSDCPEVNHIDGDKTNNKKTNLEWVSPSQNVIHANSLGLICHRKGQNCWQAKLSEQDVLRIIAIGNAQNRRYLATIFNVSPATISDIISGRTWRHLRRTEPVCA